MDPGHVDRFTYHYDRNSNRIWRDNKEDPLFGELYQPNGVIFNHGYDPLDRMRDFHRGELSASGSNGSNPDQVIPAERTQLWMLDAMSNWNSFFSSAEGAGPALDQHRAHDARNEITLITGEDAVQPEYDDNGNTTKFPAARKDDFTVETKAVYDAWNRLVKLADSADDTLAEYRYDATGRRIVRTVRAPSESSSASPSTAPGSTAPGGPPPHVTLPPQARVPGRPAAGPGAEVQEEPPATGGTITYHDYFTPSWQLAEVREEGAGGGTVREQYVWSLPAPEFPDALVLRDRSPDGTGPLDERLYIQQDAVGNVTSLVGQDLEHPVEERFVYDPYGIPLALAPDFLPEPDGSRFDFRLGARGLVTDPEDTGAGLIDTRGGAYHPNLGGGIQGTGFFPQGAAPGVIWGTRFDRRDVVAAPQAACHWNSPRSTLAARYRSILGL